MAEVSPQFNTYGDAIQFLYSRINYEQIQVESYSKNDFKLERMRILLSFLGDPHKRIPAIHVAGTKGKGSTCTMIASVLTAAKFRVGLYISPHISVFEERMTVDGQLPSPEDVVTLVNRLIPATTYMDALPGQMQPTYFELATAMAWLHFEERSTDFVVLEVGLGGRLDSTNVCCPLVSIITNVSRDHTQVLGSTVRQIAWEKGGIIKQGVPLVSGVTHNAAIEMIDQICREKKATRRQFGEDIVLMSRRRTLETDTNAVRSFIDVQTSHSVWREIPVALRGFHQAINTALALAVFDELRQQGIAIAEDAVRRGLAATQWPGRVEVVAHRPTVVIDAAHNWESARALLATLSEEFRPVRRLLIFAATRDKDVFGLLRLILPQFDTVVFTKYNDNPRGVTLVELQSLVRSVSNREVHFANDPADAWHRVQKWAGAEDLIAITGSFFLVAELRDLILFETADSPTN